MGGKRKGFSRRCDDAASYVIPCGLWGFNGSCPPTEIDEKFDLDDRSRRLFQKIGTRSDWTDVNRAIGPERLHDLDSGLTIHVRDATFHSLKKSKWKDKEINEINSALRSCAFQESQWQGFRYPPEKREVESVLRGYFGGTSRVEAVEHRTMLQIWIPVLCRFLEPTSPQVRLAAAYTRYYMIREQRGLGTFERYHTPETLQETSFALEFLMYLLALPEFHRREGRNKTTKDPDMMEPTPGLLQPTKGRPVDNTSAEAADLGEKGGSRFQSYILLRILLREFGVRDFQISSLEKFTKVAIEHSKDSMQVLELIDKQTRSFSRYRHYSDALTCRG